MQSQEESEERVQAARRAQEATARAERAERNLREKEQELQQQKRQLQNKTREHQQKTTELEAERNAAKEEVARLRGTDIGCLSVEELKQLKSAQEEGIRRVEEELGRRAAEDAVAETSKYFVCPVSQALMKDPVQAADGHTYERDSIEEWIRRSQADGCTPRSPKTNLPLANTSLTQNLTLKGAICEAVDLELGRRKRARDGAENEGEEGESARTVSRPKR